MYLADLLSPRDFEEVNMAANIFIDTANKPSETNYDLIGLNFKV